MTVRITILKKPIFNSTRDDFAMFDVDEDKLTEEGIIEEFTKVIRELGWWKRQDEKFSCTSEFSDCGTSVAEGTTSDT